MTFHKVRDLLAEIIGVDEEVITPQMALSESNGIAPIDVAALVIACEKTFKITIHDEDVASFACVSDLAAYIGQKLEAGLYDMPERTEEDRTAWFYE